jgi:hypothetical protein
MKIILFSFIFLKFVFSKNLLKELNLKNCSTSLRDTCAQENLKKVIGAVCESAFETNGTNVLDPFYLEYMPVIGSEVEGFHFTADGFCQYHFDGAFITKNEHEDSFFAAMKLTVPFINGSGDYSLNYNLGVFHFKADGKFYCKTGNFQL